jgi:hypothetical protein
MRPDRPRPDNARPETAIARLRAQCRIESLALEKLGSQRSYVLAGSPYISDKRVFEDEEFDGKELAG